MILVSLCTTALAIIPEGTGSSDVLKMRTKVDEMDTLLRDQQRLLGELQGRLSAQERVIGEQQKQLRQQGTQFRQQKTLIRQLHVRLSRQETLLLKETQSKKQLQVEKSQCQSRLKQVEENVSSLQAALNTLSDVQSIKIQQESGQDVISHDVMTRSDDGGPLEAVVGQLSQRVTEISADVQALTTQLTSDIRNLQGASARHDTDIRDARTSTFIHWGSSSCANSTQLVYTGVVGGSPFTEAGAATNYLCLAMSGVPTDLTRSPGAHLAGTEYQTGGSPQDRDAVCAVCRPSHSTTIMIPGTNVCAAGWTLQYTGYLMAGHGTAHVAGTEFICVDTSLESRPGSGDNHDGKLLYYTGAVCGSLPCQPYAQDRTIVCAVCSL